MKKINLALVPVFILLASCVPSSSQKAKVSSSVSSGGSANPGTVTAVDPLTGDSNVAMKTFNQYNMTLAKATNVDSAKPAIVAEYELIKNSLPADHTPSAFTAFHQITQTRLAFAYCNEFVDSDAAFKAVDYTKNQPQVLTTMLLGRFIGDKPASTSSETKYYNKYNEILLKIFNNDAGLDDAGAPIGKLIPVSVGAVLNKNLMKLSCTALLSSSEFTLL